MPKRALIALLLAGAALTTLLSVASLFAGATWLAELTSHFRVQYACVALLLAGALATFGRRRVAAAMLAVAGLNAFFVTPYLLPRAVAVAAAGQPVRLLVVNLEAGNPELDKLARIVEREAPDVILLMEYTPAAAKALAELGTHYPYSEGVVRPDPWGIALLSRLPIEAGAVRQFDGVPAIDVALAGPAGRFRLVGVHLRPPTRAKWFDVRNAQLETLSELSARIDEPLVVAGDFNLSPYSPYYTTWLRESGLADTLVGHGLGITWPSYFLPLGIPIDHAFVSAEFSVSSRRSLENFGSDHLPVLIELNQDDTT